MSNIEPAINSNSKLMNDLRIFKHHLWNAIDRGYMDIYLKPSNYIMPIMLVALISHGSSYISYLQFTQRNPVVSFAAMWVTLRFAFPTYY
jgi:hypothetical protein